MKRVTQNQHPRTAAPLVQQLHRRFALVSLWYSALAAGLLVVIALFALYTPSVASYVLVGAPSLDFLTRAEAAHMADVHALIRDALLIALSASIVLASYWLRYGLDRSLVKGAIAMQLALCVLLVPFPWTFQRFHHVFFPQGNWQFATDSWLISHYPTWLFGIAAVVWFAGALGILAALYRTQKR